MIVSSSSPPSAPLGSPAGPGPAGTPRGLRHPGILARYGRLLPLTAGTPPLTLGEGDTPLVRAPALERRTGLGQLWLKCEGGNPTGSFKDRGMVLAVAKAAEEGARAVVCASTGNTSAAAAAYAARSGLTALVLIPDGYVALGKLAQAFAYGAHVLSIQGNFDDALRLVRELDAHGGVTVVNSINHYRLQGQQSAAWEICDELGAAPDILAIPVGNAGNVSAYWMGFRRYQDEGLIPALPRMYGFQAEGAAAIVRDTVIAEPATRATAIRIGNPASRHLAVAARDESGGLIEAVTDEEIAEAYELLAREEGIFAEPASAASVAGLLRLARAGRLPEGATAVCVLTGHGLKDPAFAVERAPAAPIVAPTLDAILAAADL
jgi:threonine synthase